MGEEFKFWIGLVIVALWVISGIREAKQREKIKRQREERLRSAPPPSPPSPPSPTRPIEAVSEEGLTARDLIEQILQQPREEEYVQETTAELTAAEHVMTEAYESGPLSTAEQMAAIRQRELAKLAEEGRRRVGQSSSPIVLPKLLFPQGAAQVIIASEILQPPKAMRSRHASGRF